MAGGVVDREALSAALDAMDAAFDRVVEFDCAAFTTPEQLALLEASIRPPHTPKHQRKRVSRPDPAGRTAYPRAQRGYASERIAVAR